MTQQHTPGPWIADLLPVEGDKSRKAFVYAGPDNEARKDICDIHNYRGKAQKEANARLISAAPELLWIAEATAHLPLDGTAIRARLVKAAHEAIAKATGPA